MYINGWFHGDLLGDWIKNHQTPMMIFSHVIHSHNDAPKIIADLSTQNSWGCDKNWVLLGSRHYLQPVQYSWTVQYFWTPHPVFCGQNPRLFSWTWEKLGVNQPQSAPTCPNLDGESISWTTITKNSETLQPIGCLNSSVPNSDGESAAAERCWNTISLQDSLGKLTAVGSTSRKPPERRPCECCFEKTTSELLMEFSKEFESYHIRSYQMMYSYSMV